MVYFENHNKEPDLAEVHYIPHNVEETRWFLDEIEAPHFKWAFNVAHGHLVPEGWAGFVDAFGTDNIAQVRVNDNTGEYEVHMVPGEGTIDFAALFARMEGGGYEGWYNLSAILMTGITSTRSPPKNQIRRHELAIQMNLPCDHTEYL